MSVRGGPDGALPVRLNDAQRACSARLSIFDMAYVEIPNSRAGSASVTPCLTNLPVANRAWVNRPSRLQMAVKLTFLREWEEVTLGELQQRSET